MIRPITLICWLLALGSGLYLYRAKHEVELMDKHIELIAKETSDIRTESRHLLDEWIRLGEPEQLRKYSDQYLGLKTIEPPQFVRLSDLPNRLPQPQADPGNEPADVVAQSTGATVPQGTTDQPATVQTAAYVDDAGGGDLPVPPIPPSIQTLTVAAEPAVAIPLQARPVTPRPAAQPETSTQKPRPAEETRTAVDPRPAVPKPVATAETHPASGPDRQASGASAPNQDVPWSPRGMPPAQAPSPQGPPPIRQASQGLPPLQAQSPRDQVSPRPVPAADGLPPLQAQAGGVGRRAVPWQTEPAQGARPVPVAEQRGQPPRPMTYPAPTSAQAPVPGGSLLGMSHGSVPLPLPAPTPVSATWTGPGR